MQISFSTNNLLAQHLHWVNNGYDLRKINDVIKVIRNENPISCISLSQLESKIGKQNNTVFDENELKKITYLFPKFINFDCNLNFLKHCENLEVIDLSSLEIVDISDLSHLKNLTKLNLSSTKIESIEALSKLDKLVELNIQDCIPVSLKPLINHKNLNTILIDDIENEDDILEIISNQQECISVYVIENKTNLNRFSFPKYWLYVKLDKDNLTVEMKSLMTDKWGSLCEFPSEMLEDVCFMDEYMELLNSELDKRVNAILKSNFEILNEQKYYNNEEIELGVQLKIKRLAIG